jgi:hypothetical protein
MLIKYTHFIQERTEMQRAGAKMAALCTPQEVTKPGFYFSFFLVCRLCRHKGTIDLFIQLISVCDDHHGHKIYSVMYVYFSLTFYFCRQPRRVITIL